MKLEISSFGRKYGQPEADLILDVRCLENPFWVPELREHNGLEREVQEYILARSGDYLGKLKDFLSLQLQLAEKRECELFCIAVGCTGGRHRSVCVAKLLSDYFETRGYDIVLSHRDIDRD